MMCANATVFACTHSPRLTTATRSTTPGSSVPRWAASAGTTRSMAAAYSPSTARSSDGGQRPGRRAEPGDRDPLDLVPVDEPGRARRALDLAAGDGDRRAEHRPDDEPDLPQALVRDPAARPARPPDVPATAAGRPSAGGPERGVRAQLDGLDVRERLAEHARGDRREPARRRRS